MCEIYNLLLALGILSLTSYQNTPWNSALSSQQNPILPRTRRTKLPWLFSHIFIRAEACQSVQPRRHWISRGQDGSPVTCPTASRLPLRRGCGLSSSIHESFSTATVQKEKRKKKEKGLQIQFPYLAIQFWFGSLELCMSYCAHCKKHTASCTNIAVRRP